MRKIMIILLCILCLCGTVRAAEEETLVDTSPLEEALPDGVNIGTVEGVEAESFWDKAWDLLTTTFQKSKNTQKESLRLCALLLCVVMLCAMVHMNSEKMGATAVTAAGALGLCGLCMGSFSTLLTLASDTVREMTDYSAAALPVLASTVALNGGISASQTLYTGTVLFSQVLMQLISKVLVPLVYFYLAVATAEAAIGTDMLSELREFIGWVISKSLRIVIYIFLAYMSLTGVISGSSDAAAVKATKAAVSGMVPVVGGIISDASETLLASASMLKNTVGIFGMLAVIGICIAPFLRIGVQYLLLKMTAAVSGTIGMKSHVQLLKHFSTAMGYLLAMCGSCALLLLIAGVCFLKVVV